MKAKTILLKAVCIVLMVVMLFNISSCNRSGDENKEGSAPSSSLSESSTPNNTKKPNTDADSPAETPDEPIDEEPQESEEETEESSETEGEEKIEFPVEDEEPEVEIAETKSYYNDDGSLSYEECFDKDGVLVKKIEYLSSSYKKETFFDINRKKTKEILYNEDTRFVIELNDNENAAIATTYWKENVEAYTVFKYDSRDNMIKEIVYNSKGELLLSVEFEYNIYGALVKEKRQIVNIPAPMNGSSGDRIEIEYDPEDDYEKHIHKFALNPFGYSTIEYENPMGVNRGRFNFKILKSYVEYSKDGELKEKCVRENDKIKYYRYNNGKISIEETYDKDGNYIESKRY